MFQVATRHSRGLLILFAVAAMAFSACGGSTQTPSPSPSAAPAATSEPTPEGIPVDTGGSSGGLGGSASAFSNVNSFKFTMTEVGGSLGDTLSMLPVPASGNATYAMSGTFILQPDQAADITVKGTLHVVSIGGSDYQDMGLTGGFTKTDSGTTSQVDSLSPVAIYSSFGFKSGFDLVGSEPKNGVDTDHYGAGPLLKGTTAQDEIASVAGVDAASWTADVWIAKSGGYPVSLSIVAKAADGSVVYERAFDITSVNDAANKVTAPTNVTGA